MCLVSIISQCLLSLTWFHYGFLSFTCCLWLICHKQKPLIYLHLSQLPPVLLLYYHICGWHLSTLYWLHIWSYMGLSWSALCSSLVFYCVPNWICWRCFDHLGAPSRAESILLNKNVWQFVAVNGPILWHKRVRQNWGDALLQLCGPVGSFRARLLHSELFNGYRVMP